MFDILLNASIIGGIVFLLWYLSYPLSERYFNASWHYSMLKIAIAFMLFLAAILNAVFNNMSTGLFAKSAIPYISEISGSVQAIKIDYEKISYVNAMLSNLAVPQTYGTNNTVSNVPYIQIIWFLVSAALFIRGIYKMHKFKKQIFHSISDVDHETVELFLQCREQLGIRGNITLRASGHVKTPLVFGFIRTFIIFPKTDMSADEKRLSIIHELTHIKNGDLWLKFLTFIVSVIHWFNPLVYLLRSEISLISEEYCDECMVDTMTAEEKRIYGGLILKIASDEVVPHSKFCSTLSAPAKNVKRRLLNMMTLKKSRKMMAVLSFASALIICSFATIYTYAANTYEQVTPNIELVQENDIGIIPQEVDIKPTEQEKIDTVVNNQKIAKPFTSSFYGINLQITGSEDARCVSFQQMDGTYGFNITITDGAPKRLVFSSFINDGTLKLQIQQNDKFIDVPLGDQTVSLDSFDDGELLVCIIADDAEEGQVIVECLYD